MNLCATHYYNLQLQIHVIYIENLQIPDFYKVGDCIRKDKISYTITIIFSFLKLKLHRESTLLVR